MQQVSRRAGWWSPLLLAIVLVALAPRSAGQSATAPQREASPRIVNVINFIRGVEPRGPVDLVEPVREQIRLAHDHGLSTTFLIQYDALVRPEFVELLKAELGPDDEVGAWLEVVQPQVEAAGLEWRGRFPWDWHTDVGFTVGYTPDERRRLMDVYMERFREVFGRLPKSVGCWVIDAPTLNYLADEYDIVAACICKDQMGTDGYNLWGGYWNQAYYPSRDNAFMPAQTDDAQLNVPVFRMLGSDPIYQYDTGLGQARQGVISLEPVYRHAGGDPDWVRWFFDVNVDEPCLAFAYAQAGQENSFGWPAMSDGLKDQYALLESLARDGRVRVETLEASGRWFVDTFDRTPATAVVALEDWRGEARRSVWYESARYRVNLLWEGSVWRIRDVHLFDERYAERYLDDRVTTHHCTYDTLPVVDGFNWSRAGGAIAGMRLVPTGAAQAFTFGEARVTELGEDALLVTMPIGSRGEVEISLHADTMRIEVAGSDEGWALELSWDAERPTSIVGVDTHAIRYRHQGFEYVARFDDATVRMESGAHRVLIQPTNGAVSMTF